MSYIVESNSLERHRMKKILSRKNLWIALFVFLLITFIAGYLYEATLSRNAILADEGNPITINEVKYNYTVESEGEYTIVVDSSAGSSMLNREALLRSFDGNARLFFYDRPGYGMTEGESKTPKLLAEDLHFMFRKFGWKGKFILIGEEYGSLVMQEFMNRYPEEIAGAIMINPLGTSLGTEAVEKYADRKITPFFSRRVLGTFGIPRLLNNTELVDFFDEVRLESAEEKSFYTNLWLSREHIDTVEEELLMMTTLDPIEVQPGLLGESPLYLITSNKNLVNFSQEVYLDYSSNAQTFIVSDSVADTILERPQDIASAINGMIQKIDRLEILRKQRN